MDGLTVSESNNGDPVLGHFYNNNAGTATEATVYITNSSGITDGLFLETTGASFTTVSGFVQDSGVIGTGAGASGGLSIMTRANADMRFYTNGHTNERMRIDSSGNLLVGTTSSTLYSSSNQTGTNITAQGGLYVAHNGTNLPVFNRITSDGDIVDFRKNGTAVGSIGVRSGVALTIDCNTSGFAGLDLTAATILPRRNNALNNGEIALGEPSYRFKDLYLSGGVYLGGTGAANKLDDYEEGTWTGTLTGSTTAPSTAQTATGTYTKIGNLVTVNINFDNKNNTGASGNAEITGLPFTCGDNVSGSGWNSRAGTSTDSRMSYIGSNNTIVWVNGHGVSLAWTTTGTGTYANVTITFMTT
jgi:hypothetical protein